VGSVSAGLVVAAAERELGTREIPWGSNSGPRVQLYQASTHLRGTGWPWCAAWVEYVWERAGLTDHPADPSTWIMYQRAKARGELGAPRPGGAILWPGTHTGLVVAVDLARAVVHTIEGNTSDQVARRVRAVKGAVFVNPRDLSDGPVTVPLYWLEDPGARVDVYGPWRLRSWAERKLASLEPDTRRMASIVEPGTGGYAIRVGRRLYGPWRHLEAAKDAQAVLERRLGRGLRRYRTERPAPELEPASAEELGRTV
jgi:hypothetical protein